MHAPCKLYRLFQTKYSLGNCLYLVNSLLLKEKIKQLQQALSRAQDEIRHLKTTSQQNLEEKDTAIARKSAEEIHLKEQLESSNQKYEEEIASLRQGLKGV